jgi:hypothetical protein
VKIRFKPAHTHHCPDCSGDEPCGMDCTLYDSEPGERLKAHPVKCGVCMAREAEPAKFLPLETDGSPLWAA